MKRRLLFCLVALLLTASIAAADEELLGWDVAGQKQYGQNQLAPTTVASPITTSLDLSLTRGSGIQTFNTTSAVGWGGYGWSTRNEQNATSFPFNNYFTFGLMIAPGNTISLTEVSETYRRDGSAPNVGVLQYSLDGGNNYVDFASLAFGTTPSGGVTLTANRTQTSALQHLAAGTSILFRQANWYFNATPNSSANWYIADGTGDDLSLYGTVVSDTDALIGDINQDKSVNAQDIGVMLNALTNVAGFGSSYGLSPEHAAKVLDLNDDGQVSNSDLQWLLNYLKAGNGNVSEVPEPSSFVLGIMAAAAMALNGIQSQCRRREVGR